jgi:hypothetical protein
VGRKKSSTDLNFIASLKGRHNYQFQGKDGKVRLREFMIFTQLIVQLSNNRAKISAQGCL